MTATKLAPIPLVKVAMPPREQLMPVLEQVLYSGMIGEGEQVYNFEKAFGDQFGLNVALATNSGTGALHIALLLTGAGKDTEVITTSMTAEPTNTVIMQTGATPIFADVEPDTGNLCPQSVASMVTDKTVAICVVHYAGYPANLKVLREIADRHGIALVEDCAHALGARYDGKPIGTYGNSAIFSFQAIKHMTTVDGGLLTLRDQNQKLLAQQLRWFGLTKGVPRTEADMTTPGYKYNMNNVAAILGLQQLEQIDGLIARHRDNGRFFDQELTKIKGLQPARISNGSEPSYWLYTLLSDHSCAIEKCLAEIQVNASKLHRPNHFHSAFAPFAGPLPGVDEFYRKLIHIPCGWWVSNEDRQRIVEALAKG